MSKTTGITGTTETESDVALDFTKLDGLVAAVVQDATTRQVLMVGFMNDESYRRTLLTGFVVFYSRSRNKLWMKGESSGHTLRVLKISTDCDRDALLIEVEAAGPGVCHEGYESCFFRTLKQDSWVINSTKTFSPTTVYATPKETK